MNNVLSRRKVIWRHGRLSIQRLTALLGNSWSCDSNECKIGEQLNIWEFCQEKQLMKNANVEESCHMAVQKAQLQLIITLGRKLE